MNNLVKIADRVAWALENHQPVVALESTVIAHGLPYPLNLDTARECEAQVARANATPATIGIIDGTPVVGLNEEELQQFGGGKAPDGSRIEKVGLNNFANVITKRQWGATTVAGTMRIAEFAGIKVFATGGIGGVHRGASESFDISADLTALSQIPIICVCAGAKAILDLPKTLEYLETLGVPVVGFQTDEFPAFYSRHSGLQLEAIAQSADEAATLAACHWRTGANTAVLVCVPVPKAFEIPASEVESAVTEAMRLAEAQDIRGKVVTPFLLAKMKELTGGNTLKANRALLLNNAAVAGQIAASLSRLG